jgi:hypothetical protein
MKRYSHKVAAVEVALCTSLFEGTGSSYYITGVRSTRLSAAHSLAARHHAT